MPSVEMNSCLEWVCGQSSVSLLRIEVFPSILPYTEFTVYFYLSLEDNKAHCPPQWLQMFALCKRIPRASCHVSSSYLAIPSSPTGGFLVCSPPSLPRAHPGEKSMPVSLTMSFYSEDSTLIGVFLFT